MIYGGLIGKGYPKVVEPVGLEIRREFAVLWKKPTLTA